VTRVSDAPESAFSFATRKAGKRVEAAASKVLMRWLRWRGWDLDQICLSFIGYEGRAPHVRYQKKLVHRIVRRHGGIYLGKGPGALYDQKKFDIPYIRDFLHSIRLKLVFDLRQRLSDFPVSWLATRQLYRLTSDDVEIRFI
jgi:alkyldihydroxyacetonephosphate synthase